MLLLAIEVMLGRQLPEPLCRRFGRNVALRSTEHFEADHKLPHRGRPQEWRIVMRMNALAYGGLNNLDAAEKSARAAVKLVKDHHFPRAEYVLGLILAKKSDYNGALGYMLSYFSFDGENRSHRRP